MSDQGCRVFKFGGSSLGSPQAIEKAAGIVLREGAPLVVVVSASAGTTDLLLSATAAAFEGEVPRALASGETFRSIHLFLVEALIADEGKKNQLIDLIEHATHELQSMCESIGILRELTPRTRDAVVARGERLMGRIFTTYLAQRGLEAKFLDAAEIIFAERRGSSVWPDLARCEAAARERLLPIVAEGVAVVPGYIGSGPNGEVVTLGRGGSDFSAAIIARSIDARSLTLFKEVDGLMTTDPRSVPDARLLPELHYREAAELAFYGARVLHPRTMIPLVDRRIPLEIRNTFHPDSPGTRIGPDVSPGSYPVKALTAIHDQTMISVEGSGMMGVPGIAARTFAALAAGGHSVSMISQASSEASICFVVPAGEASDCIAALRGAFAAEIERKLIDDIRGVPHTALLAIVGLGMRGTPGIASRCFAAISREGVNVIAIAQGSSELNITVAIRESDVVPALQALHREFQLSRIRPLAESRPREASVSLLGFGRIGRSLVEQMLAQEQFLGTEMGVRLQCMAVTDRSGMLIEEAGFPSSRLRALVDQKSAGHPLRMDGIAVTPAQLHRSLCDQLWVLPSSRSVLVDVTAEETAPIILDALRHGSHVVLANKKPLAVGQADFEELMSTAREQMLQLRYEATVGAGLPLLDTFAKLREAGDAIESIVGCLSGTVGYLMTQLEDGTRFSEAVRKAYSLGYTEPDPRDDLSGIDVARKALILARTIGMRLDLKDIEVDSLFPAGLGDPNPENFLQNLEALDTELAERVAAAARGGAVVRYIARIENGRVRVGLEAVPRNSPMGRLRGTDNQIVIQSRRYSTNPLVMIGPGAGADVTAAGVLNDIIAIATDEGRPRERRAS